MKRTRSFRMVAAGVVVALTSAVAVQTTTQSASANDYQQIYQNLDDALGVLLTGFGDTVTDYLANESALSAGTILRTALSQTVKVLLCGPPPAGFGCNTVQFASIPLALLLFNGAVQQAFDPFLAAIDDPSLAASLFTADDLSTIFDNLEPALRALLTGGDFGFGDLNGVLDALGSALLGNLMDNSGLLSFVNPDFVVGDLVSAIINSMQVLTDDGIGFPNSTPENLALIPLVGVVLGGAVAQQFAGAYIDALQNALQPTLGGTLGAVTGPVASLLRGFVIPPLPTI